MAKRTRRSISQRSEWLYDMQEYGVSVDTREVFLHGHVGENWEDVMIDHRVANRFLKNMTFLESINHSPILIHQCTCGGEWNYGMAIYDRIAASPCRVTLLAHAHARSMSSIIPLAADFSVIMPNADYMLHFGDGGIEGESTTIISEAEWWKMLNERMLDIYTEATAASQMFYRWSPAKRREFIRAAIQGKNWYLTARQSVEYGFMDAVLGDPEARSINALLGSR